MSYPSAYTQSQTLLNPSVLYAGTTPSGTVIGQVTAGNTFTIPATAQSWSVSVSGANATINGVAAPTGTSQSAADLAFTAIVLVAGSATTINYTYQA